MLYFRGAPSQEKLEEESKKSRFVELIILFVELIILFLNSQRYLPYMSYSFRSTKLVFNPLTPKI